MLFPALLAAFVLTHNPWFLFSFVNGRSMTPTLPPYSLMLGVKRNEKSFPLQKADIVIFHHAGIEGSVVKRISGLPGDTAEYCLDQGECLEVLVPDGAFFVMGDNRLESVDSRKWEIPFVYEDEIEAVVKAVLTPSLSFIFF